MFLLSSLQIAIGEREGVLILDYQEEEEVRDPMCKRGQCLHKCNGGQFTHRRLRPTSNADVMTHDCRRSHLYPMVPRSHTPASFRLWQIVLVSSRQLEKPVKRHAPDIGDWLAAQAT